LPENPLQVEKFDTLDAPYEGSEIYQTQAPKITSENLNQNLPTGLVGSDAPKESQPEMIPQNKSGEVEIFRFPPNNVNKQT
jgi:hypothetical protein